MKHEHEVSEIARHVTADRRSDIVRELGNGWSSLKSAAGGDLLDVPRLAPPRIQEQAGRRLMGKSSSITAVIVES